MANLENVESLPGIQEVSQEQKDKYLANVAAHVPGIANEAVIDYYNKWAPKYEQDLDFTTYRGTKMAADLCDMFVPDKNAKVLDAGAGTGTVAEFLARNGFKNIDALEPAAAMLEVAKTKNLYTNYYIEPIRADQPTTIPENSYDAVVLSGAFGEGRGVNELARVAGPKGYVIIVMRAEYLEYVKDYTNRLEPLMQKLVDDGVWSRVLRVEVPNYSFGKNGVCFVFRKN